MGAIIHDNNGEVICTYMACPFTIEAYGLLLSIKFYKDLGISKIVVEGDTHKVISGLQNAKTDWSQGICLIQDTRCLLSSFEERSIKYVYREANMVAHELAKNSPSLNMDLYDVEMVRQCIWQDVLLDVLNSN